MLFEFTQCWQMVVGCSSKRQSIDWLILCSWQDQMVSKVFPPWLSFIGRNCAISVWVQGLIDDPCDGLKSTIIGKLMGHVCSIDMRIFFKHLCFDPCGYFRSHVMCSSDGEIVIDYFNHDWKPMAFEQTHRHDSHLHGLLCSLNGSEDPVCQDSRTFCFMPQVHWAGGDCGAWNLYCLKVKGHFVHRNPSFLMPKGPGTPHSIKARFVL